MLGLCDVMNGLHDGMPCVSINSVISTILWSCRVSRIFKSWDQLSGALGGAILVDGVMAAYTVAEALTDETVVIHFEKGDTQYKGVYQAINQMFLAHLDKGFRLVNREQDLDDEGLRKAKLSYHPVDFLKKYQITVLH